MLSYSVTPRSEPGDAEQGNLAMPRPPAHNSLNVFGSDVPVRAMKQVDAAAAGGAGASERVVGS